MVEKLYHPIQLKIKTDVAIRTDMNINRVKDYIFIEPVLLENVNIRELGSLVVGLYYKEGEGVTTSVLTEVSIVKLSWTSVLTGVLGKALHLNSSSLRTRMFKR